MDKPIDTTTDYDFSTFGDCIVELQISLFRNCAGFPFLSHMRTADRKDFLIHAEKWMGRIPSDRWNPVYLKKISEDMAGHYKESGTIPFDYDFPNGADFFYLNNFEGVSLFFLHQEQVELRAKSLDFNPFQLLQNLIKADQDVEKSFPYTVSLNRGYLNSTVDRTGAGIEASIVLVLPALEDTPEGDRLLKVLVSENLQVTPYFCPVLKEPLKGYYRVSTTALNGEDEEAMINRFVKNITVIVKMERLKRREWTPEQINQIHIEYQEAIEALYNLVKISMFHAYNMLSVIRKAVLAGVSDHSCATINWLLGLLSPNSIKCYLKKYSKETDINVFDTVRAQILKDVFWNETGVLCTKD